MDLSKIVSAVGGVLDSVVDNLTNKAGKAALAAPPPTEEEKREAQRQDWLSRELKKKAAQFTDYNTLTIFLGTYNVNAKKPGEELTPWLLPWTKKKKKANTTTTAAATATSTSSSSSTSTATASAAALGTKEKDGSNKSDKPAKKDKPPKPSPKASSGGSAHSSKLGDRLSGSDNDDDEDDGDESSEREEEPENPFEISEDEEEEAEEVDQGPPPPLPDIYAIGFEEIVDLNAGSLLMDHDANVAWEAAIKKVLPKDYLFICSQHLVGILLAVYVKRELADHVTDVQIETAGVGILGVGGNKGGVAIRFQVDDSTICIVNTHLAAHEGNVQGRNSDFHNICAKTKFTNRHSRNPANKTFTIFDHDLLFWMGDLNYRLNMTNHAYVFERIKVKDWEALLSNDQLLTEKAEGNAFNGFTEFPITFAPTYKYQPGTNRYERRENKKKRLPAWCDRILYYGGSPDISQLDYCRAELLTSDHKPVMARYEIKVKVVIKEKQQQVNNSLLKQWDKMEKEKMPKISLSRNAVHFESVTWNKEIIDSIRIDNSGKVPVQFDFTAKLPEKRISKPWLTVFPLQYELEAGEHVDIQLGLRVHGRCAYELTTGVDNFEDDLIIHVNGGRDYYVKVTGDYFKSCYGTTIDYLVQVPEPIRMVGAVTDGGSRKQAVSQPLQIPKELWRQVDYVFLKGLDEPGIFVTGGNPEEMGRIREALDTGADFGLLSPISMAASIVELFDSLTEPVLPPIKAKAGGAPAPPASALYTEEFHISTHFKDTLTKLSDARYNVLIYITAFCKQVLKHADNNQLTAAQLAAVFSRCLQHAKVSSGRRGAAGGASEKSSRERDKTGSGAGTRS